MNQSEREENVCNRRKVQVNASEKDTIGFGFASHWFRTWREFYFQITERSGVQPKETRNYFR